MDTHSARIWNLAHKDSPIMVFDWVKAAEMIRDRILVRNLRVASAGLQSDWEWTGGVIFSEGRVVPQEETYTYLSSNWAKPELNLDGDVLECFCLGEDSPGWGSNTYWPPESLEILNGALEK